jgi:hypothetical protein
MKKLKLNALQLGATEVLTRAQLKNVLGGDGSGDEGGPCLTTACSLTVQNSDGTYSTFSGNCATSVIITSGPTEIPPTTSTKCYCDAGLGSDYVVSSNGGVSRCKA